MIFSQKRLQNLKKTLAYSFVHLLHKPRVVRIDSFFDWAYPLAYLILVAMVVYPYFGRG